MSNVGIRNLAAAITLQAVKDFFAGAPEQRSVILRDLRSPRMEFITGGMSVNVAEQLEKRPEEIKQRLRANAEMFQ